MASQSRAAKYAKKRSSTWLAAFSSRRVLRVQFFKAGERGVEVCLVEHLAAVDQVAFDRQKFDLAPLGVEALLRGPTSRLGDDRSEIAQPMHGLDVDVDVRHAGSTRRGRMRSAHPARTLPSRRWSMFTQSGVVAGSSRRLSAA